MTKLQYAERVCERIAHPHSWQDDPKHWGWRDYLARWVWLREHGLEWDP